MEDLAVDSAKNILQDLVVVVSLVRTLAESFGSASDLYRKLKRKGKEIRDGSDDEGRHRRPLRKRRNSDSDSDSSVSFRERLRRKRSRSRKREKDYSDSDEESIYSSGAILKREYDRGYDRLGERFAIGDLLAQNHLQAQIITLQQTIIKIYQSSERNPPSNHLVHLLQTARSAREASTEALASLYKRLLPEAEHERGRLMPGTYPLPLSGSSELVIRPGRSRSRGPERTNTSSNLFCPYSADLQRHSDQPLAHAYNEGGDGRCPYCRFHIRTRPGRAWEIILEHPRNPHRDKVFLIGNRFMIKSHRQDGGFACILCHKYKDSDTVCGEIAELVDHLWREHKVEDLERDEDIREVG